jgi:hypothetical protein
MATFDPMAEFERLLSDYGQYQQAAILTAPEQGSAFLKLAFAGFTQHEQPERWSRSHSEFIQARREGELSDESLDWYEEGAASIAAFACLAIGAMLGLLSRGEISETEFLHADALLPGFLLLHNERIEANGRPV